MTEQSNAAAERSAHVERGAALRPPGESFLVEVKPGVFQIKAVALAERERDMWREENAKKQLACEQMGARIVALEAEMVRLRTALSNICDRTSERMRTKTELQDAVDGIGSLAADALTKESGR